ncbi:CaiB/BaiF CoA transferase family protein [Brevibacterium aurantiacum]|uniref:CaiB/BaiF CoA transferase family protein n=1 Tax=Brevibacterium aurantiacum TaxID=273384 RepID=UPI001865B54E|nr:CaiB/BaiF CoA-transferase family protein [Brevibacterium aurantiacum]
MPTELPLSGITVISCEQAVAAPFASRQLADLGARVIKIERPGTGDFARGYDTTVNGMSSHFVWINRNKESLSLDLKQTQRKAILKDLVAEADVFIQNFAPGAAERLGFGAEELRGINDRLIYASISGYGPSGPYKDAKAYDALVQAEAGLVSVTGTEDHPAKTGISTADISAGMYTYSGILTALFNRERTGEGTTLQISLFDSLVEWMGYPLYFTKGGGTRPTRAGTSHAAIAPYGAFTCGDGTQIMLAIQNEREWKSFASRVLDRPDMVTDERFDRAAHRYAHRDELQTIIEAVFADLTGVQADELLETASVAHSRQRDMTEIADHPQLVERDRWQEVGSPVGPIQMLVPPVEMSGVKPRMDPIPGVGEHSADILGGLGFSPEKIAELQSEGVI